MAALTLGGCSAFSGPSVERGQAGFVRGFLGGAAAEEPRAALVAREVLSAGGSAMDAAVAAGFALTVTLPSRAGLGGGGACLVFEQSRGETQAILFEAGARSAAPGADRPAAVPMMARGLFALHTRGGRLRFEELIRPAEDLARTGNPISRAFAGDLAAVAAPLFADPQARAIFAGRDGAPLGEGAQLVQRDLAVSLSALRTTGPGDIHQGALARRLAEASISAGGGLTVDDMRAAVARLVPPVNARQGNDTISFLPTATDPYTARNVETLAAGRASLDSGPPGGGASTALVTFDREGNAVACAFTMNNLFGTGRVAPGTGILLAAAPNTGAIRPAPLAITLTHNQPTRAFRLAVAASGQESASNAAALATNRLLRGAAPQDAIPPGLPNYARAVVASCPRYLPGRPDECVIAADPRGSGIAAGAAPR